MNLHKLKFYCSVDLKVASIILVMQSASSAYPCIYCEVSRKVYSNMTDQDMEDSNQTREKPEGIEFDMPIHKKLAIEEGRANRTPLGSDWVKISSEHMIKETSS